MNRQPPSSPLGTDVAVTHILVVTDPARSRDFWLTCGARKCSANTGNERARTFLSLGIDLVFRVNEGYSGDRDVM